MRTAFEEMLAGSLRDRADASHPVDPAPLLHDARQPGRRIRARRRLVTAVVAAGAVAAVVLTGAALGRPGPARPVTSPPPARPGAVVPPRAIGTPGAATDPGLVGSDPWVLHLSVDALAGRGFDGTWRSTSTYELASGFWHSITASVAIARDPHALPSMRTALEKVSVSAPAAVTVACRPGTMVKSTTKWAPKPDYTLDWQPVPGLSARLVAVGSTPAQALQAAAAVRFDQATRCAQPFAVGALPAGLRVQYCHLFLVTLRTGVSFGQGDIEFGGAGRGLKLQVNRVMPGVHPAGVTRTVGGLTFSLASTGAEKYTRPELLDVLNSIHLVGSPADPSTYR